MANLIAHPAILFDFCTNCIFHSVDYIYTFINYGFSIKFEFVAIFINSLFYNNSLDLFVQIFKFYYNALSDASLFYAHYLNRFFSNNIFVLNNQALYYLKYSNTGSIFISYYPELTSFCDFSNKRDSIIAQFLRLVIENEAAMDSAIIFVAWYPQLAITILLIFAFISYMTDYRSEKKERVIDQDYLASNASLDAEEELSSIEELLIAFFNFFYVFI